MRKRIQTNRNKEESSSS